MLVSFSSVTLSKIPYVNEREQATSRSVQSLNYYVVGDGLKQVHKPHQKRSNASQPVTGPIRKVLYKGKICVHRVAAS